MHVGTRLHRMDVRVGGICERRRVHETSAGHVPRAHRGDSSARRQIRSATAQMPLRVAHGAESVAVERVRQDSLRRHVHVS